MMRRWIALFLLLCCIPCFSQTQSWYRVKAKRYVDGSICPIRTGLIGEYYWDNYVDPGVGGVAVLTDKSGYGHDLHQNIETRKPTIGAGFIQMQKSATQCVGHLVGSWASLKTKTSGGTTYQMMRYVIAAFRIATKETGYAQVINMSGARVMGNNVNMAFSYQDSVTDPDRDFGIITSAFKRNVGSYNTGKVVIEWDNTTAYPSPIYIRENGVLVGSSTSINGYDYDSATGQASDSAKISIGASLYYTEDGIPYYPSNLDFAALLIYDSKPTADQQAVIYNFVKSRVNW